MVVVSYSGKEINAKLVYYGCGLSGKTTNLESIYEAVPDTSRGKMVSMKTQSDRTLFFDLLPLDLGEIMGFKTRFLLYTVPGQVFYNATRKLVLKGADAIVFVADSEVGKMEENKDSLANLRANLAEYGLSLDQIPWVIQYNKRDLPNVYTLEELNAELNPGGKVPFFEAVAKDGRGVFETFRGISHLLMEKVTRDLRRGPMGGTQPVMPAQPAAPAAPPPPARPATLNAPPAPAHAMQREAQPAATPHEVDYGREVALPEPSHAAPAPAATRDPVVPPARPESPPSATPRREDPVPAAAAPRREEPATPAAAPPRREEPAPASAARPAAPSRSAVLETESAPAPSVRVETVPAGSPNGLPQAADELVVPVTLPASATHEIVLRIVLRVEPQA